MLFLLSSSSSSLSLLLSSSSSFYYYYYYYYYYHYHYHYYYYYCHYSVNNIPYQCDITCAGHFTLDALASRTVACLKCGSKISNNANTDIENYIEKLRCHTYYRLSWKVNVASTTQLIVDIFQTKIHQICIIDFGIYIYIYMGI